MVSGTVQGVGFRAFVQREAQRLGITGWVRNRSDGTVEILMCSSIEQLRVLEATIAKGPRGARVVKVERRASEEALVPLDFRVLRDA
ncbi:MAG: acylphosphatase [Acidiferrobacter sp.]